MVDLSVDVRLRPARIALLVRPGDRKSVRRFMRICACLWGGMFNPIVPVFRRAPSEWSPEPWERVRGYGIARGYIEFYEPDAFVEAESGLSALAGLDKRWDESRRKNRVFALDELLRCRGHSVWTEPSFGLSMVDPLQTIYDTEQRFKRRDRRSAYLVAPGRTAAMVEALFGVYPLEESSGHFSRAFREVYRPTRAAASVDVWRSAYLDRGITPLRVTGHGLDVERDWKHGPVILVFDPNRTTDLIDLWNLRAESYPVFPVPKEWFPQLVGDLATIILDEYRQVDGAGAGVMHRARVEFSRSMTQESVAESTDALNAELQSGKDPGRPTDFLYITTSRDKVWVHNRDRHGPPRSRIKLIAAERRVEAPVQEGGRPYIRFDSLAPEFARRYALSKFRWTNEVRLSNYGEANVATVLPFNAYDVAWPRLTSLMSPVLIGSEGWCLGETRKDSMRTLVLYSQEEAVIGSLGVLGIEAELSDPGQIARQIVEHVGGLRSVHLLADIGTLKLLNTMAGGQGRWRSIGEWKRVLSSRPANLTVPEATLKQFTDRNIIRLGVTTSCAHCQAVNWSSLTTVDYELACERCRKPYAFPQASLSRKKGDWAYRVVGPFSVPDYARGSYGALLALNAIRNAVSGMEPITYSTALSMSFDGLSREADFVLWHSRDSIGRNSRPRLVVGEAKSLGGGDLIGDEDIKKLKEIGSKLPGSMIAVSVLKEGFSKTEQARLRRLVRWGRRLNNEGGPTNPVLLLTGTEIFFQGPFYSAWKGKGGAYAEVADRYMEDLPGIAEATVGIYLGLPSFAQERERAFERRHGRSGQASR